MRNGGNTATAVKPAGTKATADAAIGLPKTLGDAPPPEDPGAGEPGGAPPVPIAGGRHHEHHCHCNHHSCYCSRTHWN